MFWDGKIRLKTSFFFCSQCLKVKKSSAFLSLDYFEPRRTFGFNAEFGHMVTFSSLAASFDLFLSFLLIGLVDFSFDLRAREAAKKGIERGEGALAAIILI